MRSALIAIAFSSLAAACGYSPDLGGAPFVCGDTDPKCPDGYECRDDGTGARMVCFDKGGDGKIVDANMTGGFQCADDSNIEGTTKNDDIAHAFQTPVQSMRNTISYRDLAICPEGDKDTYMITLATISDIEVITSWDSGQPVSVVLLGPGGATLVTGTSSGAMSQRAFGANLAVGTYYAQAYAAATTKNNYSIAINTTPK